MDLYLIDFETSFSTENTLTRHSIEEYVRHPKFEVIGLGWKNLAIGEADWIEGGDSRIRSFLHSIEDGAFIAHHAQFDGFICNEVYNCQPAFWFDTLSMSRALYQHLPSHSLDKLIAHFNLGTPKTVPYNQFRGKTLAEIEATPGLMATIGAGCLHDIELTHRLFNLLVPQMPADELELIDECIRLYTESMLVGDEGILSEALTEAIVAREEKMHAMGLTGDVLKSDAKFAKLLRGAGVQPPMKLSERTGREAFALAKSDLAFQALEEHPSPYVRDLYEARVAAKTSIHETRAGRLLGMAGRGKMPVYCKWYGAHTGRPSGGDKVNFLNMPRGSKIRSSLKAPEGHCLVWGDMSQQELRLTAWLSGCQALLEAFREGRDVYSEDATKFFKKEVTKDTHKDLRRLLKEVDLGCGYGMGKEKFAHYLAVKGIEVPRNLSDALVDFFRSERREIPKLWRSLDTTLQWMDTPNYEEIIGPLTVKGRKIWFPDGLFLDYTNEDLSNIWGGRVLENIIQKLGWITLKEAWLIMRGSFATRGAGRVVLPVYDELVCCVPLTDRQWCLDMLGYALTYVPNWAVDLPMACELYTGQCYDKSESPSLSRTSA